MGFFLCRRRKSHECKRCGHKMRDPETLPRNERTKRCPKCGFAQPGGAPSRPISQRKRKYQCVNCGRSYRLRPEEWENNEFWECEGCGMKGGAQKVLRDPETVPELKGINTPSSNDVEISDVEIIMDSGFAVNTDGSIGATHASSGQNTEMMVL